MRTYGSSRKSDGMIRSIFVIAISLCLSLGFAGFAYTQDAAAASMGNEIKQGDTLQLVCDGWSEDYIVLDPTRTNTGEDGTFVLLRNYNEKTHFERSGLNNVWENSTAQKWCTDYYRKLPEELKASIIGVKTIETESGYEYADINNIDGTRTGDDSDKDKVFFISYREYDQYKDPANITSPTKWWLRNPGSDCSEYHDYACAVMENGRVLPFCVGDPEFDNLMMGARPAFNLAVPEDICAKKTVSGDTVTWTYDMNSTGHSYGAPVYTWSPDNSTCTGEMSCTVCGEKISESVRTVRKVLKEPTAAANGEASYTAEFSNTAFGKQVKKVSLDKLNSTNGSVSIAAGTVCITSVENGEAAFEKAANRKTVSVPDSVMIDGRQYVITEIKSRAFTGKKIKKVIIGKNVRKIGKNAFAGSSVKTVVLKTSLLKKAGIKGCLKGSKVSTIRIQTGKKAQCKKMLKKYKKVFTPKVSGKKVKLK